MSIPRLRGVACVVLYVYESEEISYRIKPSKLNLGYLHGVHPKITFKFIIARVPLHCHSTR